MPSKVTFSDGSTIVYSYAADGTKLRTVHTISGTATQTDYCNNVVYVGGAQKYLLTGEGYVDLSTSTYYYYLKDHQGNNRVVVNSSGTVAETNHYYPFGGVFASGSVQPYKYNGKELDTKKGLNWYDYGARHYDAALGRWFVVDPLSEKYYSTSSFVYCNNNPFRYIDPNGKDWKDAWPHFKRSFFGNISFGLRTALNVKVSSLTVGADINAGSIELGTDGYKLTQGIGVDVGIAGFNINESVYKVDDSYVIKEENVSVNVAGFSMENETKKTYDATGKYYEEVDNKTALNADYSIGVSAAAGIGVDIGVNLQELYNFVIKLFE